MKVSALQRRGRRYRLRGNGGDDEDWDDQGISNEDVIGIFQLIQVIISPIVIGFFEYAVNCAVELISQGIKAVTRSDLIFDQCARGDVAWQRCGGGEFLAGGWDQDSLTRCDETAARQAVQFHQDFNIHLELLSNSSAVIPFLYLILEGG